MGSKWFAEPQTPTRTKRALKFPLDSQNKQRTVVKRREGTPTRGSQDQKKEKGGEECCQNQCEGGKETDTGRKIETT
jgi:hypothetical protein